MYHVHSREVRRVGGTCGRADDRRPSRRGLNNRAIDRRPRPMGRGSWVVVAGRGSWIVGRGRGCSRLVVVVGRGTWAIVGRGRRSSIVD